MFGDGKRRNQTRTKHTARLLKPHRKYKLTEARPKLARQSNASTEGDESATSVRERYEDGKANGEFQCNSMQTAQSFQWLYITV